MEHYSGGADCFAVRDYRGQRIKLARGNDGSFEVLTTEEADSEALVLYRLPRRPTDIYVPLLTNPFAPSCLPVFESRSERTIAIRHPLSDLYVSSEGAIGSLRPLPASRLFASDWELFELSDVEAWESLGADILLLDRFERSTDKALFIISALLAFEFHSLKVLAMAHHTIVDSVYDAIAAHLVRHPDALRTLATVAQDPYIDLALLPLLEAVADAECGWRRAPRTIESGAKFDFLNESNWGTRVASFWHGVNAALRRSIRPSRNLCIVTTVRNEGIYILEWIAYHLLHGVDHFFVYTNDNDDGSDLLLSALSNTGFVTIINNNAVPLRASAQSKAYAHALTILLPILDFAWCGIIDVDEFVVLDRAHGDTLLKLLSAMSDYADALVMRWVTVGSQIQAPAVEQPLTRRCLRVFQDDERVIKSFIRPQRFVHASPHVGAGGGTRPRYFNDANEVLFNSIHREEMPDPRIYRAIASRPCPSRAVLFHYYYKSPLEFIWKSSRNRGDHPKTVGMAMATSASAREFLSQMGKTSVPPRAVEDADKLADRLSDLLGVAAIADAYRIVLAAFAVRCSELIDYGRLVGPTQPQEVQALLALAFDDGPGLVSSADTPTNDNILSRVGQISSASLKSTCEQE